MVQKHMVTHPDGLSEEVRRELLAVVEKMPAFPIPVQRILSMTSSPGCSPRQLVEVIEHDPVLTGRIMKVVNSAYFSLPRTITSVRHATVFVGINTIRNLALSIAAIGALTGESRTRLNPKIFLTHALVTGAFSRQLAKGCGVRQDPAEEYFLSGLLHDVGQIALSMHRPEEYSKALRTRRLEARPLVDVETEQFGFSHALVGQCVIQHWSLPESIGLAVGRHHDPQLDSDALFSSDCLYVANLIAERALEGERIEDKDKTAVVPEVLETLAVPVYNRLKDGIRVMLDNPSTLNDELTKTKVFTEL